MEAFEVLEPGPYTTVQDLGRYGYQRLGIPVSGALDCFALRIANILVGNDQNEAGLEITLVGLKLKALASTLIAITGANLEIELQDRVLPFWAASEVEKGQVLNFRKIREGCRAYLAVAGGIDVPESMGSKSTYVKGRLGGVEGRMLMKGDKIRIGDPIRSFQFVGRKFPPELIPKSDGLLRIIMGPQAEIFEPSAIHRFFGSTYQVTRMADRMGVRLKGPPLEFKKDIPRSIISEAVVPGCIQIPGDGIPIIVLLEQTVGGYAKVGTIISSDLWKVGQAKPGDLLRFREVPLAEGILSLRSMERDISAFASGVSKAED